MSRGSLPVVSAGIFLGSCVVCLVLIAVAKWHTELFASDMLLLGTALAKLYGTPVAVMVGAAIAGHHWQRPQRGVLALVMVSALIWNAVVISEFATLAWGSLGTKDVQDFCREFSEHWTFLIAGVTAAMAGKSAEQST